MIRNIHDKCLPSFKTVPIDASTAGFICMKLTPRGWSTELWKTTKNFVIIYVITFEHEYFFLTLILETNICEWIFHPANLKTGQFWDNTAEPVQQNGKRFADVLGAEVRIATFGQWRTCPTMNISPLAHVHLTSMTVLFPWSKLENKHLFHR